ncbi:MAG: hypothetical protein KME07_12700 [Pegethrix bostrychoides GSE-TBD4-15B]|uniref:Uncharacterized protein n=1 Tax=Pegethrix bostrychoides GSE-TBD4-15B TaxID=2839662 RepID=A0A951PB70_9CYAN|nr:hypothetical protein [Pegethrix bostrychoides GSE-TBD4-15B]
MLAAVLAVGLSQLDASAQAVLGQIRVVSAADAGVGSLRWAIEQANAEPNQDVIELDISESIVLGSPLPAITSSLMIQGNGVTVRGGANRVFWVEQGDVTLRQLVIADGLAQGESGKNGAGGSAGLGGGLFVEAGTVTLIQVQFVNNQAVGGSGSLREQAITLSSIQLNGTRLAELIQTAQARNDSSQDSPQNGSGVAMKAAEKPDILLAGSIPENLPEKLIKSQANQFRAAQGAVAGVNGIGIGGIGSVVFGGGGGFGGFGNAGHGGNGGDGGQLGHGGNGGNGGNGGVGLFGRFEPNSEWVGLALGKAADKAADKATVALASGGNGGNGGNGGFGGGGGAGGNGGAGGLAGQMLRPVGQAGQAGKAGFGGGDGSLLQGGGGAGLGGAIFVKSGRLLLSETRFERNRAVGGQGGLPGLGKAGAIFVMPEGRLRMLNPPKFIENQASDAGTTPDDNADICNLDSESSRQ